VVRRTLLSCPTRRSSDLKTGISARKGQRIDSLAERERRPDGTHDRRLSAQACKFADAERGFHARAVSREQVAQPHCLEVFRRPRSEEHTSELQSRENLVC